MKRKSKPPGTSTHAVAQPEKPGIADDHELGARLGPERGDAAAAAARRGERRERARARVGHGLPTRRRGS